MDIQSNNNNSLEYRTRQLLGMRFGVGSGLNSLVLRHMWSGKDVEEVRRGTSHLGSFEYLMLMHLYDNA